MTQCSARCGYRELKKVVEALGFVFKNCAGSHHHFKHPQTGVKVTLPMYRAEYSDRLVGDIAWQMGISRQRLVALATDKRALKAVQEKGAQGITDTLRSRGR